MLAEGLAFNLRKKRNICAVPLHEVYLHTQHSASKENPEGLINRCPINSLIKSPLLRLLPVDPVPKSKNMVALL